MDENPSKVTSFDRRLASPIPSSTKADQRGDTYGRCDNDGETIKWKHGGDDPFWYHVDSGLRVCEPGKVDQWTLVGRAATNPGSPVPRPILIQVLMLPGHFEKYQQWLAANNLMVGLMAEGGTPLTYVVTPIDNHPEAKS